MCKYCESKKTIRSSNWHGNGQISVDNNGNLYGKDDEVFRINYCPMCGAKLEEEDIWEQIIMQLKENLLFQTQYI